MYYCHSIKSKGAQVLDFEHTIVINEKGQPDHQRISRESLWKGLLFRARYPGHFNPAIKCRLVDEHAEGFTRRIFAGELEFTDVVTVIEDREIRTLIDGRNQPMHAESVTRIESAGAGELLVRFRYRRDSISGADSGVDADEFLKSAYVQNDREAIEVIREMIAEGWSDAHM